MKRILLLAAIAAAILAFFVFDLDRVFTREFFIANKAAIDAAHLAHPWRTAAIYFALYVAMAGLSLPGATVLTLAGGAVFGLWKGVILISLASTLGATVAFLTSRFLLSDWVRARLGGRLARIDQGIAREGAFYLFALRLVPAFPFWLVNLAMGLTRMKPLTYLWVSQLGMLPATVVYTWAGTQLGAFKLSAGLILAFVALGLLPLAAKRGLDALRARRVVSRWSQPARFDFNLVVIGAGAAGLVSSLIAAATRAKVALVERHRMGGDCLNTGCVPSKTLIRTARLLRDVSRHQALGVPSARATPDFGAAMERVRRAIKTIAPHDSVERYTGLGVEVVQGSARITSPWTVEVQTAEGPRTLTTKAIVIATGARPVVPPIPGIDLVGYLTSETLWDLRENPGHLLLLGAGPIGCELAMALSRLGVTVTLLDQGPRVLPREDDEVSALVRERLAAEGVKVRTSYRAKAFIIDGDEKMLVADATDERGGTVERRIGFDQLLVAAGRVANTHGLGLEELGIATTHSRTVEVDAGLQTIYPNITAAGDVAGPWQFTHTASHQAWTAAVNALFGSFKRFRQDTSVIPWCTYLDPEVARVGLNEREARAKAIAFEVVRYELAGLDRAITDEATTGWVKVLVAPGSDKILGATIVAEHAGEMIAEFVLAMKHGLGLNQILATLHTYPTWMEANKAAAGQWRRAQVTQAQTDFLASFQSWRRGEASIFSVLAALPALIKKRRQADDTPAPEA
ncbi:MAG: FAD-dependent oxidoreductase [Burkholderiaceae bacterium]